MAVWRQELKKALKGDNHSQFAQHQEMDQSALSLFPAVITDDQLKLIDWQNQNDPIAAQFLPTHAENHSHPDFKNDPVGDMASSQNHGIIHKYKGRVLLIASGSCAVNCRYCFRRHFDYAAQYAPRNNWQQAIAYISQDDSIEEVILSGGDPLTLSTEKLRSLTNQLSHIKHIKTLRIHSRIPVVLPSRIDDEFIEWLTELSLNTILVLHINHAQELSPKAQASLNKLEGTGSILLNQSVLLKNINDSTKDLTDLSQALIAMNILPYYLHLFDRVQNASHFEVPLEKAQQLHQEMQQKLPGYMVPKLVQENQGEASKTWING